MPYISSKWERIHERRYKKMTESVIVGLVKSFLLEKADGNWHEERSDKRRAIAMALIW